MSNNIDNNPDTWEWFLHMRVIFAQIIDHIFYDIFFAPNMTEENHAAYLHDFCLDCSASNVRSLMCSDKLTFINLFNQLGGSLGKSEMSEM